MDARAAQAFLDAIRGKRVLWLMHVNADPDCLGSALALQEAFGGVIGAPEGMSKQATRLAARVGFEPDTWPHPENHDVVVAVDTSSRAQLGRMGPRVAAPLLVDHHRYGDLQAGAPAMAFDATRGSCAEVVLAVLDLAGKAPSKEAALALLCGLVADSARFRHADARALRDAGRLLEASGATMEDVLALLEGEEEDDGDDPSRRRAVLAAAQRAQVESVGPMLLATSEVGSFDAAAALALVRCGADLAIVGSERSDAARMSLRASTRALGRGLHLGELANEAARAVGWSGGGHEGAAGLSGKPPLAPAREAVLRLARARLQGGSP